MQRLLAFLLCILALGGCTNFYPPASKRELGPEGFWLNYDAGRRGAVVLKKTGDTTAYAYCAEQAPDVAMTLVTKLSGDAKAGNTEISKLDAEATATAVQLAGRTQLVLLTRESLYRLCEISMNTKLTGTEIKSMLVEINSMIKEVAEHENKQIEKEAAVAQAKRDTDVAQAKLNAVLSTTETIKSIPSEERSKPLEQMLNQLRF